MLLPCSRTGKQDREAGRESRTGKQDGDDALKQILAVVKPFLAQRVLESLSAELLDAVQIREVKGYGRQKSYLDRYGESEFSEAFVPKVEITVWVEDAHAAGIVQTIATAARTGRIGDGKIMIVDAESAAETRPNHDS
jgi:nitrogen regulatory protein PII